MNPPQPKLATSETKDVKPFVSQESRFVSSESTVISLFPPPTSTLSRPERRSSFSPSPFPHQQQKICNPDYVLNPNDRSILLDHHDIPITIDRMLHTKPLQSELLSRPGPGSRRLTYLSGESVTRTLNEIFGFDGWNLTILSYERIESRQDSKTSKWHVAYHAHVRITLSSSGVFREDIGNGDAVDKVFATAAQHAMKSSVTDAMKRAARHFGDRLGNSLYESNFSIAKAPVTQQQSLDDFDKRLQKKYGTKPNVTSSLCPDTPSCTSEVDTFATDSDPSADQSALNTTTENLSNLMTMVTGNLSSLPNMEAVPMAQPIDGGQLRQQQQNILQPQNADGMRTPNTGSVQQFHEPHVTVRPQTASGRRAGDRYKSTEWTNKINNCETSDTMAAENKSTTNAIFSNEQQQQQQQQQIQQNQQIQNQNQPNSYKYPGRHHELTGNYKEADKSCSSATQYKQDQYRSHRDALSNLASFKNDESVGQKQHHDQLMNSVTNGVQKRLLEPVQRSNGPANSSSNNNTNDGAASTGAPPAKKQSVNPYRSALLP